MLWQIGVVIAEGGEPGSRIDNKWLHQASFGLNGVHQVMRGPLHEVLSEALRMAPGLAGATLPEMRVGLRPASPDGLPLLGRAPGFEQVFLAAGHGPSGLQLGPYSGAVVADLLRGLPPLLDLTPFAPERFQG